MKREINLRTREFVIAREFHWPRVVITLAVVGLIAFLSVGSFMLYLYRINLITEISFLESRKGQLEAQAAPVEQMEAEIRNLRVRADLKEELAKGVITWSAYFREIETAATRTGISVNSFQCPDKGQIKISGSGPSMRSIAFFVRDLNGQAFLGDVAYTIMDSRQDGVYFDVNGKINGGGTE